MAFSFYDGFDPDYDEIIYSDDPKNIDCVSMLRHYINCHGITSKLKKYTKLTYEQLSDAYDYCKGSLDFKELMRNPDKCIEEGIERKQAIEEAHLKNMELQYQLEMARSSYCGIDTRNIKLMLNRLAKKGDKIAKAIRTLMETEDENIKAKSGWKADWHYNKKYEYVMEAIKLYKELDLVYGMQRTDNPKTNCIAYFELPTTNEQISFHLNIDEDCIDDYPKYEKEWDGIVNSTLPKIEKCITELYQDEINLIIEKRKKKAEKEKMRKQ